jgi:hypothetical protein
VWACGCADARAVRGRSIASTKVRALPESLGQCKLLETLCVPRPPPPPPVRVRGGAGAAPRRVALPRRALGPHRAALDAAALPVVGRRPSPAHGWRARPDRRSVRGGPEPPGAAARWARRSARYTELAALPAAADWPNLKIL